MSRPEGSDARAPRPWPGLHEADTGGHGVQFYGDDRYLVDAVGRFVGGALGAGEGVVVIATLPHLSGIEARLRASRIDLARLRDRGGYLVLDADETLVRLLADGWPSPERFADILGGAVDRASHGGRRAVRIFGELVALLSAQGRHDAALRLEALWNDLARRQAVSLLCGYPLHAFARAEDEGAFLRVCAEHSAVLPAESYAERASDDERLRTIARLQQEAAALSAEVMERRALEQRLRQREAELASLLAREQAARAEAEEERRVIETLHRIGTTLTAELDLQRLVQLLTDEATALAGAEFGAFFYNAVSPAGEAYQLYTLSGAPREAFAHLPMPRNTPLFASTFRGEGIIRLADVTADPRYGSAPPYHGMPPGHLPVRSYLAVPVASRSGEVLGGLFFGHPRPGVFTERHERLVRSVAAQAAVALDNARLYEEAQAAIRLRDDFLSIASHELKTPLTSLQLHVQLLLSAARGGSIGGLTPERLVEMLGHAERQGKRVNALIDELLEVSRITAGRLRLDPEEVDLAQVVETVVAALQTAIARSGSTVTVASGRPAVGRWDRLRVELVVTNLLANALKYGDGKPVEVEVAADPCHVSLTIRDHGIGVAPEDRARIFERFERAVSGRHYGGLGIGLYVTREIVQAHGGSIAVESEGPGRGSTFVVVLPRRLAGEPRRGSARADVVP